MISCSEHGLALPSRRQLIKGAAAGAGLGVLSPVLLAQNADAPVSPQVTKLVNDFLKGGKPLADGLKLDLPVLGDKPASVPIKVRITLPVNEHTWCE